MVNPTIIAWALGTTTFSNLRGDRLRLHIQVFCNTKEKQEHLLVRLLSEKTSTSQTVKTLPLPGVITNRYLPNIVELQKKLLSLPCGICGIFEQS